MSQHAGRRGRGRGRRFPIPMRGNALQPRELNGGLAIGFPIPMRGNEDLFEDVPEARRYAVSDPHEG